MAGKAEMDCPKSCSMTEGGPFFILDIHTIGVSSIMKKLTFNLLSIYKDFL